MRSFISAHDFNDESSTRVAVASDFFEAGLLNFLKTDNYNLEVAERLNTIPQHHPINVLSSGTLPTNSCFQF